MAAIISTTFPCCAGAERLWNTVSAVMPDSDCRVRWVVKLDKAGYAVSTGSACSSGKEEPSRLLAAMGYPASAAARALAFEELLISEGSDWNWWYGPEHGSDNRAEFDQLYRDHLANVYRALQLEVPDVLNHPILHQQPQEGDVHERPTNVLEVTMDGEITTAFEWMGAGRFRPDPRSGAMHGGAPPAREMLYGFRDGRVFVLLHGASLEATYTVEFESGRAETRVVANRVVELEAAVEGPRFRISVQRNGLAPVTLPHEGWIDVA